MKQLQEDEGYGLLSHNYLKSSPFPGPTDKTLENREQPLGLTWNLQ